MNNSQSNFSEESTPHQAEDYLLGKALVKLEVRLESIEIKVLSLTKIVKLLQQYSEKKDQQYQKQTHNMQILDSKFNKMNTMHTQLGQVLSKYEETNMQIHNYSKKIEQMNQHIKDNQTLLKNVQDQTNFEYEEIKRKIKSLESTVLNSIRSDSKNQDKNIDFNINSQNYKIDELSGRFSQLQSKLRAQTERMKSKIDKFIQPTRKSMVNTDNYGLQHDRSRKSKSKSRNKEKDFNFMKRLKSK